jgi:hypothetical protein
MYFLPILSRKTIVSAECLSIHMSLWMPVRTYQHKIQSDRHHQGIVHQCCILKHIIQHFSLNSIIHGWEFFDPYTSLMSNILCVQNTEGSLSVCWLLTTVVVRVLTYTCGIDIAHRSFSTYAVIIINTF